MGDAGGELILIEKIGMRVLGIGVVDGDDGTLGDAQVWIGPKFGLQDEGSLNVYIIPLGKQLQIAVDEYPFGLVQGQPEGIPAWGLASAGFGDQ